jgi:heptosyltransferase-3
MRALVIKLGHLGDVLLASPVVTVLAQRFPGAEVDALVYAETADMLSGHPHLTRLFTIQRDWKQLGVFRRLQAEVALLRALRGRRHELVIALSDKLRIAWLVRLMGAARAVTADRPDRPALWRRSFTHLYSLPPGNTRHTVETHLDALRALSIEPGPEQRRIVLVPGAAAERRVEALLAENGLERGRFVHVHPASRWLFKCWPATRLAALINLLQARGERIVVTGAADENETPYVNEALRQLEQPVVDLCGKLNLKELAALIARARVFMGVDSAPLHMASAMGTPAVVLFGPSGEKEWGPWQIPSRVVVSAHSCRPCGFNGCGGSNRSDCLEVIPVERVLAAVDELLHAG